MNRIIVIYGHHDCGKTETINFIRELIRQNGGVSLSSNPPYTGDKPETFHFKGQIVCVCPGGDSAQIVTDNFNYAYSKNADIIITASRSRGASPAAVGAEAAKWGIKIEWFQKSYEYWLCPATQTLCNREFATVVFGKI